MTTDLMLVTRRAPTMADVRAAVADARRQAGLGAAQLVGDLDDGDPMVELTADVSQGELLLQIFRPTVSLSTAADPYTVRIGREPPLDDDGHCWLTAMAMAGTATEKQTVAVIGVVRHLALAADGYLVVNGEYTPLDGVPEPARTAAPAPSRAKPPPSRAFVEAFLTRPIDGPAGWVESMDLLRDLLDGTRDLRPRFIERDKEWRPFLPTDPAPDWWPMSQYLLTPEPHVRWHLRPSHGPAQHYSQVSIAGDLDAEVGEQFLPKLIELARADLDYGLIHAWHDDEPGTGPTGLRHGPNGPWMLFTPRDLTERLPNLYWAQIFGPPWVRLFGAETIAATPGHRVEEVSDGHWLVQLTEHLADVVTEHARFAAIRAQAKAHLGADAFFSPERGPRGRYRAPDIPTLKDRGLA
jgi:hypothetical protein